MILSIQKLQLPFLLLLSLMFGRVYAQQTAQEAISAIVLPIETVKSHILLPLSSADGEISFSWSSSDSSVINPSYLVGYTDAVKMPPGMVVRPAVDTKVTLSVKAIKGADMATKSFELTVEAAPVTNQYVGYLYAYFSAVANKSEVQQIHFAISDDGIRWRDLNENKPVLTSVLGDKGVRDPYIIRSAEGDHFYLIATDLDIYATKYGGNWGVMSTQASTSLMIWESDDLVNWSEQRMVDIASPIQAGNAWAPEAIFDEVTNEYLVYWSSRVATDNFAQHRIYVSKTRDFKTFSTPEIYVTMAKGCIDASIFKSNGNYYRLIKDDTELYVSLSSSDKLLDYSNKAGLGNSFSHIDNSHMESFTGGYEGSTMFKFIDQEKWCVLIDEYTNQRRGYIPFLSTNIDQPNSLSLADNGTYLMPTGAKHGTVITITAEEYKNLTDKWSVKSKLTSDSADPIAEYTFDEVESGNTIADISTNNNRASVYGNASVINDATKGKVLYLDGTTNTYLAFPEGFFDGMDSMTISMDIKPQSQELYNFVLGIGADNNKYGFLRIRSGEVRFATTTESYSKEQEIVTTGSFFNSWMNLKLVKAGHNTKMYINNKLVAENDFMRNISDLGSDIHGYIGKSLYDGDPYFKGCFDNVKVFNRCLSESEIATAIDESTVNLRSKRFAFPVSTMADNSLAIKTTNPFENLSADVYTLQGKHLLSEYLRSSNYLTSVDTSFLEDGIYLLTLSDGGNHSSFKFFVEH